MIKILNLGDLKARFLYRVEKGDSLESICERFHASKSYIVFLNCLTKEPLEGESLLIEKANGREYVVKPGDTLQKIAGGDEEALRRIMSENKIDEVYFGQTIYVG
ncbi:MAG: LysM peptidoglycan-binding domain-containing protein [Clostridia bacterium]|nr:LysM peptidoglycan-binding domain-containing protein [Clostridia bacterium]